MHRILLIGVLLLVGFGAYQLLSVPDSLTVEPVVNTPAGGQSTPTPTESTAATTAKPAPASTPRKVTSTSVPTTTGVILQQVPFTAQAPFGEWSDPRQQDACEEAASIMAVHWARGTTIPSKEAGKQEILALADYQSEKFGENRDTSAQDTADRLIKGYYNYSNYEVKNVSSAEDIVGELENGNIIIVPANGRALGNPSFTAPGPERHMLLIKGYDSNTGQFITNEPGIRQGEHYRYAKNVLFGAIRDYESGYHIPIVGADKVMIVVKK